MTKPIATLDDALDRARKVKALASLLELASDSSSLLDTDEVGEIGGLIRELTKNLMSDVETAQAEIAEHPSIEIKAEQAVKALQKLWPDIDEFKVASKMLRDGFELTRQRQTAGAR